MKGGGQFSILQFWPPLVDWVGSYEWDGSPPRPGMVQRYDILPAHERGLPSVAGTYSGKTLMRYALGSLAEANEFEPLLEPKLAASRSGTYLAGGWC